MTSVMGALELGQRIVAILDGRRTTCKFARLMALVDFCVEHLFSDNAPLTVPLTDLSERVIALYWRQVLPLAGIGDLKQSTQQRAHILTAVNDLCGSARLAGTTSLGVVRKRLPRHTPRPFPMLC